MQLYAKSKIREAYLKVWGQLYQDGDLGQIIIQSVVRLLDECAEI